jgi:hypothetical protein
MPKLAGFMEGVFIVKEKDLEKIRVLQLPADKQVTQEQSDLQLHTIDRQILNIFKKYKDFGNESVTLKKLGKPSNRKFSEDSDPLRKKTSKYISHPLKCEIDTFLERMYGTCTCSGNWRGIFRNECGQVSKEGRTGCNFNRQV